HRAREDDRALAHRLRRDAVRDVDHGRLRCDAAHDAATDADEVVLQPEVGEEGDVAVRHRSANSAIAATRPSRSCVLASSATSTPTDSATRVVSGPIETAGAVPPADAYARAAEPDASTTTSPFGASACSS